MAKTIQRFNRTGSTQNRPRHGRPKKLSARAQHHIERLGMGGSACQCLDHMPHTASNWSASGTCRELLGQGLKYKKMGNMRKKYIYRSKDWIHYYFIFVYILCHIVIKPTFI